MTRLRQQAAPGRAAQIINIPVAYRPSFHDPAWREQFDAAREEIMLNTLYPPPRTRPLIVAYRPEKPNS